MVRIPTRSAMSSMSRRTGLSSIPRNESPPPSHESRWVSAVVRGPQMPGWMILEDPENPGMWCGTIAPRPITTSASATARFTSSGVP